jgi:hypothetical protein
MLGTTISTRDWEVIVAATQLLDCRATLVGRHRPSYQGKFRDCVDRWEAWPLIDRASAFVLLSEPVNGCDILRPRDLASFVNSATQRAK